MVLYHAQFNKSIKFLKNTEEVDKNFLSASKNAAVKKQGERRS